MTFIGDMAFVRRFGHVAMPLEPLTKDSVCAASAAAAFNLPSIRTWSAAVGGTRVPTGASVSSQH